MRMHIGQNMLLLLLLLAAIVVAIDHHVYLTLSVVPSCMRQLRMGHW